MGKIFVSSVICRHGNKKEEDVCSNIKSWEHSLIVSMDVEGLKKGIDEYVKTLNERYTRCRELTVGMYETQSGYNIVIGNGTGNPVCNMIIRKVKLTI